jgi:hypothetical protein
MQKEVRGGIHAEEKKALENEGKKKYPKSCGRPRDDF